MYEQSEPENTYFPSTLTLKGSQLSYAGSEVIDDRGALVVLSRLTIGEGGELPWVEP